MDDKAKKPRKELKFENHLSDADALMLALETDPVLRSTILSTWILDRAPDLARFEKKLERALQIIPRLRQRVVSDPLGIATPVWERDPDFDLHFHLRRSRLTGEGSVRDLLDYAAPIAMQAFDMNRPLWELHLIEGLEGGKCAAMMKLHHAISDGVGLVKMTECLIERAPEDDNLPPLATEEQTPVPSDWDRIGAALARRVGDARRNLQGIGAAFVDNAGTALRHPFESARKLRETLASIARVLSPASEPMSPLMRGRSTRVHFDYLPVSLEDLKRAGKTQGGSVNDAFVAAVGGGLARYHAAHGRRVPALRMLMPINVRGEGEKADNAGNQFSPARFEVPVGIEDPGERIGAIRALSREQRDEPALPLIEQISAALGRLPKPAVVALFGAMQRTTDFTTSNVPGPRRATWMSGAKVEAVMPFGPLAGAAANVTVFSYNGSMHVGINTDPAAIPDPELLFECLQKSFDEVLAIV